MLSYYLAHFCTYVRYVVRRCYFKCSFHRERNCRATKQVQQCSNDDPPQYVVIYFNEHTCDDTAAWDPTPTVPLDDLSSGLLVARQAGSLLLDERGVQEEHERRLLVSSLACVLGAQQQQSPAGSGTTAAVNVGHEQDQEPPPPRARTRDDAPAPAPAPAPAGVDDDAPGEMPRSIIDVDVAGLDVMDYYVTDALCFRDSYDLPSDGFSF